MNAGGRQRRTYKSFLKSVFELSTDHYGENYWKSPLMVNNIWISDLFLKVTSNLVDTKINSYLQINGYLRELMRFAALKLESSLVKFIYGLATCPIGYENIVLTFVDERCFSNGLYNDVFTGKLIETLEGKTLVIPVFVKLNLVKKIQFYSYLKRNNIPTFLAIHNVQLPKYKKSAKINKVIINGFDFTSNFKNEARRLAFAGNSTDIGFEAFKKFDLTGVINIYYPFENQIWERYFCDSIQNNKTFLGDLIGLQNAPVSFLSLRYIFPDNWTKYFPHPNKIIARDEVSYQRLMDFWGDKCLVIKGKNQRKFIKLDRKALVNKQDIFVALSIGVQESTVLLNFLDDNRIPQKTYRVAFHPLLPRRLRRVLVKLSAENDHISLVDYEDGLMSCGYVLSTTSTALVEGLYNGLKPLKLVHNSFISASPLDFEPIYEEFVSFEDFADLKCLLSNKTFEERTVNARRYLLELLDS